MRVLVIGTYRACHHRLHSHGHDTVLFMPRYKTVPDDLVAPYRHVVVLDDQADMELWVDAALACHRSAPFDAIVAYNDNMYRIAHAVSARLEVPCTVDVELLQRVLDKSLMRQILEQHDIPSCRYAFAQGREALLGAIRDIGLPCIVKPLDGEASMGVAKITSLDDIDPALQWVGKRHIDRGVVVEEFLFGEEYSVEAISTQNQHRIIAITKKIKDEQTFIERGHLVPAPLEPFARMAIENYVTNILDVFGFHDCPSHTELMLTPKGPRIIESHNRIGGDRIMDLINHTTGIDMYDLVARQSLGEDIAPLLPVSIGHTQCAVVWYADPSVPDTQKLVEVRGTDSVRKLPYIKTLDLLKKPGSRGAIVHHSFDRSGLAIAVGDTPREALRRAQDAIQALDFVYVWKAEAGTTPADVQAVG